MKNVLITGGAGFIGSNLCEYLLEKGNKIICIDNLELGSKNNIKEFMDNPLFKFYENDAADIDFMTEIMCDEKIEQVYHMAANSDIQKSSHNPMIDYQLTFSTTLGTLEAMRRSNVKRLFFASTSAVYGEKVGIKLNEHTGDLLPISYYGSAKLASEAFISSYSYMNNMDATIFRFPNVIGPHLTHGVVFDFINKLKEDPLHLHILGDGTQNKPYLYVKDLVGAIEEITFSGEKGVQIYNIGVETSTTVREIADMVCKKMRLSNVKYYFTEGNRGWKGDVPSFQYDLTRIHERGWRSRYSSNEAVRETLNHIIF